MDLVKTILMYSLMIVPPFCANTCWASDVQSASIMRTPAVQSSGQVANAQWQMSANNIKLAPPGMVLTGKARIALSGQNANLEADEVIFDSEKEMITATGNVRIIRKGMLTTGAQFKFKMGSPDYLVTESNVRVSPPITVTTDDPHVVPVLSKKPNDAGSPAQALLLRTLADKYFGSENLPGGFAKLLRAVGESSLRDYHFKKEAVAVRIISKENHQNPVIYYFLSNGSESVFTVINVPRAIVAQVAGDMSDKCFEVPKTLVDIDTAGVAQLKTLALRALQKSNATNAGATTYHDGPLVLCEIVHECQYKVILDSEKGNASVQELLKTFKDVSTNRFQMLR